MINGYHIAMDYNSGMSWTDYWWTLARALAYNVISISSIFYYIYLLVPSINKRRKDTVAFIIITLPVLFFAFKHGFVRNDTSHILSFISVIFTFFLLLNILSIEKGPFNAKWIKSHFTSINLTVFGILMITMAHFASPSFWNDNIFNNINSYKTAYSIFASDATGADIIKSSRARILQDYSSTSAILNMDELKSAVDNNTIDIIPWDISLLWAIDANWTPRPVFQSYQAYSKYLDDINRKFYTNTPPQYLLYSYKSIDNRYPLFDEPATLRTIVNNYKYAGNYGEFILLSRQNEKYNNDLVLIGTNNVKIGDETVIPRNRGYTFANIHLQYSWIGHIKEILYKPGEVYIEFIKRDGSVSHRYRIIPETLQNGVLISDYIESHSDLNSLLDRSPLNNVQSIKITCSDTADFNNTMNIEYYAANP
jgi:acetyltransferase-like isoleucine patch superfamily enzyme